MTVTDDTSLVARSRAGDAGAYAELYSRHVGVALGVARRVADRDAEDVVSEAFARTFTALRGGGGPDVAFRSYLLRAVRNAAIDRHRRERRTTPVEAVDEAQVPLHAERQDGDPVVGQLERDLAARAFVTLPQRWQTVLWHTEVQGEGPSQVAPLLGISPRAVSQLAVRAREGLRTAWLGEHAAQVPPGHEGVAGLLAPSVRSSLGRRDRQVLEDHLATCPACRRVREELVEVNATMSADVLPLVLGLAAAGTGWQLPAGGALVGAAGAAGASGGAGGGSGAAGQGGGAVGGASGGHGVLAGISGAASHPVAAVVVAAVVAASGAGGYLAWRALQEPAGGGSTPSTSGAPAQTGDDVPDVGASSRPTGSPTSVPAEDPPTSSGPQTSGTTPPPTSPTSPPSTPSSSPSSSSPSSSTSSSSPSSDTSTSTGSSSSTSSSTGSSSSTSSSSSSPSSPSAPPGSRSG